MQSRVVGLGAPVSVVIRLAPCEAPLLRAQLLKRLPEDDGHPHVIESMLASLDDAGDAETTVLWPTAYAAPVLRAALGDALDAVAAASRADDRLASLAQTIESAQAAVATLRAFLAVDYGGLQQVAL